MRCVLYFTCILFAFFNVTECELSHWNKRLLIYSSASALSWTRTNVTDEHKFSAVKHLCWRLLNQSKNAFLPIPPVFHASFGVITDPIGICYIEMFYIMILVSCYHAALIARSQVQLFWYYSDEQENTQTDGHTMTALLEHSTAQLKITHESLWEGCVQTS